MDFTSVVVVLFVTGFFVVDNLAFLDLAEAGSFASIKRSVALRLHAPSTMSAGFLPGWELELLGGML